MVLGPITRVVGRGIGFTAEARRYYKEQHEGRSPPPIPSVDDGPAYLDEHNNELSTDHEAAQINHRYDGDPSDTLPAHEDVLSMLADEDDWELDEVGDELDKAQGKTIDHDSDDADDGDPIQSDQDKASKKIRKLTLKFLNEHPLPPNPANHEPLPYPIILPQRRPRNRSRGFVQAYAPVLQSVGIDQATWMDFLGTFHKAAQASPFIMGIFIAAHLCGYIPTIPTMVCSIIVQHAVLATIVTQRQSRTNTFLDDLNQHFFRPRGLFIFLVSYKGERGKWSTEALDISHAVAKNVETLDKPTSGNRTAKIKHNMQWTSGTSHGMIEMPESAPLIYPALEAAAERGEGNSKPNEDGNTSKIKSFRAFLSEYNDRRAQARFQAENPDSSLNVSISKHFASRYSDPTHPANSGSLASLVTGGKIDRVGYARQRDQRIKEQRGFMGPRGYLREGTAAVRRVARQVSQHAQNAKSDEMKGRG